MPHRSNCRRTLAAGSLVAALSLGCGPAATPALVSTLPADGETWANPNWPWMVRFSAPMREASVRWSSVPEVPALPPSWNEERETVTITPEAPLPYATAYTVDGSAVGDSGDEVPFHFAFVTREDRDVPRVLSTWPVAGEAGVPPDTDVVVQFTEPMAADAWRGFSFYPDVPCAFSSDLDGARWRCHPLVPLAAFTRYALGLDSQAADLAGNPLTAFALVFTTGASRDVAPPSVTGSTPADGATGASATAPIEVRFSESMDAASVQAAFAVTSPVGFGRSVCRWNPTQTVASCSVLPLPAGATVTWQVGPGARDVAGNPLAQAFTASFQVAGP